MVVSVFLLTVSTLGFFFYSKSALYIYLCTYFIASLCCIQIHFHTKNIQVQDKNDICILLQNVSIKEPSI
jgi:uncharacterized membrane protein